jgi:hypothetical protein
MHISEGLQLQPTLEEDSNMGLSVRLMIRYAIHTRHYSNRVKDIRDEILIGKKKP